MSSILFGPWLEEPCDIGARANPHYLPTVPCSGMAGNLREVTDTACVLERITVPLGRRVLDTLRWRGRQHGGLEGWEWACWNGMPVWGLSWWLDAEDALCREASPPPPQPCKHRHCGFVVFLVIPRKMPIYAIFAIARNDFAMMKKHKSNS